MSIYESVLRPALFRLDAEKAHCMAIKSAGVLKVIGPTLGPSGQDPVLATTLAGISLSSPVGVAPGLDKNGELTEVVGYFGFGFHDVGSVCALPWGGNPQPRMFRLPQDQAVINRMGHNGHGVEVVAERMRRSRFSVPVGVTIAQTNDPAITGDDAVADHLTTFKAVHELPIAYVTLNASCPNTHEACLPAVAEANLILEGFQRANRRGLPIFLKVSPDSSGELLEQFAVVAARHGLAGWVCGNTTRQRDGLKTPDATVKDIGNGGLSGPPLHEKALALCRQVNALKEKNQQIIGCGGISSGADAFEFLQAGATAVQLYTALIYHGPGLVSRINSELAALIKKKMSQPSKATS